MNSWEFTAGQQTDFNKETMSWTWDDILMTEKGQFKFTHGNYWQCYLDTVTKWVSAHCNLGCNAEYDGGAYTKIVSGGRNFAIEAGYHTITLTWNLAGGEVGNSFVVNDVKTADYVVDPTSFIVSLIGSAINHDDNWSTDLDLAYEGETDGVYTYSATNVTLNQGEFKVRFDHEWSTSYGWWDLSIEGDQTNFGENNSNIVVVADKTYSKVSFTFSMDGNNLTNVKLIFTE